MASTASYTNASRVKRFLARQIQQSRKGGVRAILAGARKFSKMLCAIPLVIVVWLLRPFVLIRFGQLVSSQIGHFAGNTELFLCERDTGLRGRNAIDIFYFENRICNRQLALMWERTVCIRSWAEYLHKINYWSPWGSRHALPLGLATQHDRDVHDLLVRTKAHLSFTEEEHLSGCESLRELGVVEGSPFVCFHARDSAYLGKTFPELDLSYHAYRNWDINNCVPAMQRLSELGYFTIRMGAIVEQALHTDDTRIIDYATNGSRSDFMDIFLGAHCAFFVSCGTGIDAIPMIFRRPTIFVNFVPFEYGRFWDPTHLFIPKKHWLWEERRFLTFREILISGVGRFLRSVQYEKLGIELIENTPDEITAAVLEIDARLKGTWQTTDEDEELQRRFWALFEVSEVNRVFSARIGAEFLRQNRALLE